MTTPTTPVKTFSGSQYCTTSAGVFCEVPGNDSTPGVDTASTSDLNVVFPSTPTDLEIDPADFSTVIDSATGSVKAVPGYTNNNPKYQFSGGTGDPVEAAKNVTGSYVVMYTTAGRGLSQLVGKLLRKMFKTPMLVTGKLYVAQKLHHAI